MDNNIPTLDTLTRHSLYVILLEESKDWKKLPGVAKGLCKLIETVLVVKDDFCPIETNFPELWAKRISDSWWDLWFPQTEKGWGKRRELLRQCINETGGTK